MAWQKYLIVILLSYILALLQDSFFVHFNLFGAIPNLVFILFFLLVFFSRSSGRHNRPAFGWDEIFYSLITGFFLDIYSSVYLGSSIILLITLGFLLKKTQLLLKATENSHPFVHFLPLFLACFVIYEIVLMVSFDLRFVFAMVYNLFFAIVGFVWLRQISRSERF
jgi:cell shape-determining protein MreD